MLLCFQITPEYRATGEQHLPGGVILVLELTVSEGETLPILNSLQKMFVAVTLK